MGTPSFCLRQRTGRVLTLAVVVAASTAGGALAAAGNRIRIAVPKHARVDENYSVGLRGHASRSERLYIFLDSERCARTPTMEHSRANGDVWMVHGAFHEISAGWKTSAASRVYVCAYLQKRGEVLNAPGGILARAHRSFLVG